MLVEHEAKAWFLKSNDSVFLFSTHTPGPWKVTWGWNFPKFLIWTKGPHFGPHWKHMAQGLLYPVTKGKSVWTIKTKAKGFGSKGAPADPISPPYLHLGCRNHKQIMRYLYHLLHRTITGFGAWVTSIRKIIAKINCCYTLQNCERPNHRSP